ncbi:hypothetical protein EDD86DRAFT_202579 [Gorgonomyces haynaldii]|nr:hypothetical protein EDD86DRAFT_202579 [Gorgonomyces haynaldii]
MLNIAHYWWFPAILAVNMLSMTANRGALMGIVALGASASVFLPFITFLNNEMIESGLSEFQDFYTSQSMFEEIYRLVTGKSWFWSLELFNCLPVLLVFFYQEQLQMHNHVESTLASWMYSIFGILVSHAGALAFFLSQSFGIEPNQYLSIDIPFFVVLSAFAARALAEFYPKAVLGQDLELFTYLFNGLLFVPLLLGQIRPWLSKTKRESKGVDARIVYSLLAGANLISSITKWIPFYPWDFKAILGLLFANGSQTWLSADLIWMVLVVGFWMLFEASSRQKSVSHLLLLSLFSVSTALPLFLAYRELWIQTPPKKKLKEE